MEIVELDGVTSANGENTAARGVQILGTDGTKARQIKTDEEGSISNNVQTEASNRSYPDPADAIVGKSLLQSDGFDNQKIRGPVLTDEGSFRDDFSGTTLLHALSGTLTFANGATLVTGVGTAFLSELNSQRYIRLDSDSNSVLALVSYVVSDTELQLVEGYAGSSGAGAGSYSEWRANVVGAGATITVGPDISPVTPTASSVALNPGTTNGGDATLYKAGDTLPFGVVGTIRLSARVANQESVFGVRDDPEAPLEEVTFKFDGTDTTRVKCRSTFASDSVQETLVTIPGGSTSTVYHVFEIVLSGDRALFYIDSSHVATHRTHLPTPYRDLSLVFETKNVAVLGTPAGTLFGDALFFSNKDLLDLSEPVAIQGTAAGQPVVVQFGNPGGGTALPKMINVNFKKTEGAYVASAFKRVASYAIPSGFNGYAIKFTSFQGEAAESRLVAETNLGIFNDSTNAWIGGVNFVSPQWASIVEAEVTTAFAAGSGNVVLTVTYTNESGTSGRVGTITIPKGSVVGSRWSLALAAGDLGLQSIQSVTGTPSQVGTAKILGLINLAVHQDQSTTTQTETLFAPGAITFPTGTVIGIEYAGGTVSKLRNFDALLQLVQ